MDKRTLKSITSAVAGAETAIRFLPGDLHQKPEYEGAFGAIASVTGAVALGQAVLKKDAFNKGNRLNTAIILCLGTASILQGIKKVKQAYAKKTEQYNLMESSMSKK
ncbi:hypothetical protein Fleli_3022 [Bernardetia litoralis DSM 6794]|uniref:Uncharacterized protein n=1 Tax=Bernardetia litoralis (strain ATCC 23117 / DSM 6794 / NBRC 15988 / NCIMB 1366 / Fx l1 / Sio-4) TaxID=880071 RepID=I4AN28_BERLS|nr:hypothetical protein [Bernardetia litoralis]AFM05363.1 hypothetical protein Fleli_3022 [Bernardetia litoralis DSM 6794]